MAARRNGPAPLGGDVSGWNLADIWETVDFHDGFLGGHTECSARHEVGAGRP